jgi:hypothetical protein
MFSEKILLYVVNFIDVATATVCFNRKFPHGHSLARRRRHVLSRFVLAGVSGDKVARGPLPTSASYACIVWANFITVSQLG